MGECWGRVHMVSVSLIISFFAACINIHRFACTQPACVHPHTHMLHLVV